MTKPYYSGPWKRIRLAILERDGGMCQINGPTCRKVADQVDHIIPPDQGGAWFDASNLRAACGPCNNGRVDRSYSDRWKSSRTRITLVVGPENLATYVRDHADPSDLVVDYEQLASVLGNHHDAIMRARNALLSDLRQGKVNAKRAWITSTNPNAEAMFPHHERIEVPGTANATGDARDRIDAWNRARNPTQNPTTASRQWLRTVGA